MTTVPNYPGDLGFRYRDFLARVFSIILPFLVVWLVVGVPIALVLQAGVNDSVFSTHPAKNHDLYFLVGLVIWIALAPLCFGIVWRWKYNIKFTHEWEQLLFTRKVRFRYTPLFTALAPFALLWIVIGVIYVAIH